MPLKLPAEQRRKTMLADRVEVSWDAAKSQWLIRITEGEEVLRAISICRKLQTTKPCAPQPWKPSRMKATISTPRNLASSVNPRRYGFRVRLVHLYQLKFWFDDTQNRPRFPLRANHVQIWTRLLSLQLKHSRHAKGLGGWRNDATLAARVRQDRRQVCQLANRLRRNF